MYIRVIEKLTGEDAIGDEKILVFDLENNITDVESELAMQPTDSEIESELEINEKLRDTALDLDLIYIRTMDISYLNYCRSHN